MEHCRKTFSCNSDGRIEFETTNVMSDCNCNAFERCKWLRHFGKVMVLFVLGFIALSVWAVVVDVLVPQILHGSRGYSALCFIVAALFLFLVGMLAWSYFAAVCTEPGSVPLGWMPFADEEEASEQLENLGSQRSGVENLAGSSRPRFCRKCSAWKPPRAHHDSMTGRCVLKMDHYCVWIANCVGLLNYKAFILFLVYTFLAAGVASAALVGAFIAFIRQGGGDDTPFPCVACQVPQSPVFQKPPSCRPIAIFIAFVVDAAFFVCLAGFLGVHGRLAIVNCTTIEMYEKRRVPLWPYDRGWKNNLKEVFGSRWVRWFVPTLTNAEASALLDSALNRQQSLTESTTLRGVIEL